MEEFFTGYQIFLLVTLVAWPLVIGGILFAMNKVEQRLERTEASTPEEAGLEPVTGSEKEREVKIVFGDQVVGADRRVAPSGNSQASDSQREAESTQARSH